MPALITLTLNPALDLATTTEHVAHTPQAALRHRAAVCGRRGHNVARVLHRLGRRL